MRGRAIEKLLEDLTRDVVTLLARTKFLENTLQKTLQVRDSEMVVFLKEELKQEKVTRERLLSAIINGPAREMELPPVDLQSLGLALPGEEVESGSPSSFVDDFELAGEISGSGAFHGMKRDSGGQEAKG